MAYTKSAFFHPTAPTYQIIKFEHLKSNVIERVVICVADCIVKKS